MPCDGCFYTVRLNADIPLGYCCRAMLQKPLDKSNVVSISLIDFSSIPLAKTVRTNTFNPQIVADDGKSLLNCPRCNRED